jgi:pilus assembly protein FimV
MAFDMEPSSASSDDIGGADEVGTKLDLAKAYIDMGDPDGARGILDEVMEEGSDAQKEEAQQLLQQIA